MRQLIAGNWKMNGLSQSLVEIETVARALLKAPPNADAMICPPATLIARASAIAGGALAIGAQDCHEKDHGAFTGDLSAGMLKDSGASAVILGHSERRQYHNETSPRVAAKTRAAHRAGLLAIVCIGETEAQRDSGRANDVCSAQISESIPDNATAADTVVAYEPVWAIGTGRTAKPDDIVGMHAHIRRCLERRFGPVGRAMRVLYGGSVNPGNAADILPLEGVDGALVGGASLRASDFLGILAKARAT